MKRFLQISAMASMMMLFAGLRNTVSAQPAGDVSYQDFYDELSPYGRWIDYPEYGYVWCPDEGADFRPYNTNGHWVWSDDYEWMWVSDYSWGWAPFHYGRWFYDDMYGWMWMPGYEWSPAWVAWRSGGDYYGWAPLRPGINISAGFSIGSYSPPYNYWCFTPCRYITSPRIYDYCVSSRQNLTIINNTTIINNYNYNRNVFVTGPRRLDAERFTNSRINSVRVREISNPRRAGFSRNEVSVYRPSIQRENNNRNFAPRRFDEYRGSNNVARNDNRNRLDRRDGFNNNDRTERSNNRFENNADRRNIFNNERNNAQRPSDNRERFQQERNNSGVQRDNSQQRFDQHNESTDNSARERSVRDVFGRDSRPGIDRPVQRDRFERQQPVQNNSNINRRDFNRDNNAQRPVDNNRGFSNNERRQTERRDVFNNRGFNQQPQQQRPSFPEMRRQEAPRQFSRPDNRSNNNNNNHGGFNRGRRG